MQILPNSYSYDAPNIIPAEGGQQTINQTSPFAEMMNNIKDYAEQRANETSMSSRSSASAPASEKGFGEGAKITEQEFADMREKLKDSGLSEKDIKELENQLASDDGLTWGGMLNFVSDKLGIALESLMPELTQAMKNDLSSLFQKMGFTNEESHSLLSDLEAGKQEQVRKALSDKLANMKDADLTAITRGELKTLGKALGLTDASMNRLSGMLGESDMATISSKGARVALSSIFSDAKELQEQLTETLGELRSVIEKGMKKARDAKETLTRADNRETKDVTAAKVMIQDEARKQRNASIDDANNQKEDLEGQKQAAAHDKKGDKAKAEEIAKQGAAGQDQKSEKIKADGETAANNAARAKQAAKDQVLGNDKSDGEQKNPGQGDSSKKDADAKAWDQMWNKVEARGGKTAGDVTLNQAADAKAAEFNLKGENSEVLLGDKVPANRLASTVQKGILQNLNQGGKQLTLRMDPPSLGKLTVVLQVHNNEVRALIRTENHDATKLVHDQLNLIKHSLEQQGLKVEKLDVQTQTNNDQNSNNWQGAEQHNLLQERNKDSLQAFMNMRKGRAAQAGGLAQDVQSEETGAQLAHQQGLHLIA